MTPKHPIYVPSLGRAETCSTPRILDREGVSFTLVVEPHEFDEYARAFGAERVEPLPEGGKGLPYSRNWIKRTARERGHDWCWQLDDDVVHFTEFVGKSRRRCTAVEAVAFCESLAASFSNVRVIGTTSEAFAFTTADRQFVPNRIAYTTVLVDTRFEGAWRDGVIDDTDYSLQVLSSGACTLLVTRYAHLSAASDSHPGGLTELRAGDGRLRLVRGLERRWPGVVTTTRRFGKVKSNVTGLSKWPQRPEAVHDQARA